jgi:hypothetical protein
MNFMLVPLFDLIFAGLLRSRIKGESRTVPVLRIAASD